MTSFSLCALTALFLCAVIPPSADLNADSPVKFPKEGCLPARCPPDRPAQDGREPEPGTYLFSTPERSPEQIRRIQSEMPAGRFTPPRNDWSFLKRTRRTLLQGGDLKIVALGDSIVNDMMRSGWVALLQESCGKARIRAVVCVRGGGGCQHYRESGRIQSYVAPLKPDLVLIGGISQRDMESIRDVIRQIRAAQPEAEFLLITGAFGTADPRDEKELAAAPFSGTGEYGANLQRLAREERCAFLDMTTPWAEYIRSARLHPHLFYRDPVHANEFGEQILGRILLAFFRL